MIRNINNISVSVPAKFDHKTDYMPGIIEATKDLDISIVFNNAGYIVTGFFDQTTLDSQLANMECNATACVKVRHYLIFILYEIDHSKSSLYLFSVFLGYTSFPTENVGEET
jgi:short-subunit dehydrogenase